jgi:hypothetical protein
MKTILYISLAFIFSSNFLVFGQVTTANNAETLVDSKEIILDTTAFSDINSEIIAVFSNQEKLFVRNNSSDPIKSLEIYDTRSRQVHERINPMDSLFEVNLEQNNVYIIHVIFENGSYQTIKSIH